MINTSASVTLASQMTMTVTGGALLGAPSGLLNQIGSPASNPTNASTTMQGGKAVFENDNYKITMGDNNEVVIHNKETNETYRIWGDPHVQVDGKQAFDFWGTTTFELEDGTKVTIDTTPAEGHKGATLSSEVTITNGDYGVKVSGVDTNTKGDLKIQEAAGWGETLDWVRDDGNVLQENPSGAGFLAVDTAGKIRKVDQAYINETDLTKGGKAKAGGQENQIGDVLASKLADRFSDAFRMLGGLVAISLIGSLMSSGNAGSQADGRVYAGGSKDFDETAGGIKIDVSFRVESSATFNLSFG